MVYKHPQVPSPVVIDLIFMSFLAPGNDLEKSDPLSSLAHPVDRTHL